MLRFRSLGIVLLLVAIGCNRARTAEEPPKPSPTEDMKRTVLVFTRTTGFRHESIEPGKTAFKELAEELGLTAEFTEDPARFASPGLKDAGVVVFLNTTGDVLDTEGQSAMESYIKGGGAFIGTHSATDTEYDWPWYGGLVGAYFNGHPAVQEATVRLMDAGHPSTATLPADWTRTDEWYNFRDISSNIQVLAQLDESTYKGGKHGKMHPIAWCHEYEGGRSFYTAGGHTNETFGEPLFRSHLKGALEWAAGLKQGNC